MLPDFLTLVCHGEFIREDETGEVWKLNGTLYLACEEFHAALGTGYSVQKILN